MYLRELLKRQSGAESTGTSGIGDLYPQETSPVLPSSEEETELPCSQSLEVYQGVGRLQKNEVRAHLNIFQVSYAVRWVLHIKKFQNNQGRVKKIILSRMALVYGFVLLWGHCFLFPYSLLAAASPGLHPHGLTWRTLVKFWVRSQFLSA